MTPAEAALVEARPATWDDVELVCGLLENQGVDYVLHGGWALQLWLAPVPDYGGDIDIAVPRKFLEFEKLYAALGNLPGRKILRFPVKVLFGKLVIRLIEDFCIDVISNIGGIEFPDLEIIDTWIPSGRIVPVVSGDCLVRIKQFVVRRDPKHIEDLARLKAAGYNGNYTGRGKL